MKETLIGDPFTFEEWLEKTYLPFNKNCLINIKRII